MSPRGSRALEVSEQKERILGQLHEKLDEDGYVSPSVDEIAEFLGISKKTLYRVFPSREKLFEGLITRVISREGNRVEAILSGAEDFVTKIRLLFGFFASVSRKIDSGMAREMHRKMPRLWKWIEDFRRKKIQENVGRLMEQGKREGFICPDIDLGLFMRMFLAAIDVVVNPRAAARESRALHETMEQMLTMLLTGIMTDRGRHEMQKIRGTKESTRTRNP